MYLCIGIIVASLHIYGSVPSYQVLLKISSSLCNAGCPRLTIISLVIASGPGDFFNFRFDSALVNSSYEIVVVSDGPSLLGCDTSERLELVRRVYNVDMKECVLPENPNILNCLPFQ